ncbi:nucleosome assembly factor ASF1 [Kluyveromyces lactis]|uniref:Histone chaperone ASF1 n=1 Tax=Kluyveromyces lactis (strain ATCC 8585 / CBS 2359 / DSM 70799 / NBRC 1267 / NRRL Y-1140 / WM37) TaxID=284590 RepID=ASF1_KLULA|nr:uncharacterized protein KLLA0_E14895g [Kluyveromyces lactis]Q6CN69.1 RecName: Full=Histone chaperone ASF1; AltName: Full=Anti-silencing function protein 1 [Kluyveromyces lactis NRRL Y-1140]CAG99707.1 KLLA0E14895p [Kluyveromyces lactis]|eukprot:XP_454620.1 uncharacterized protein KLLA0_E14895g [Kluyveromyces lactis]
MSIVSLLGIKVLNNPAKFTDPYEFEITFECLEPLKHDLEWKLTYVGSSRSLDHDQELDSILVGPIPVGINKFKFVADAPSPDLIPASELVSVTVILLSCSYNGKEFVRVGYYVNNEYDLEELRENPPQKVPIDHVVRNILAEKPRVTRFNIVWDNEGEEEFYPPEQEEPEEEEEEEEDEDEDEEADEDAEEDLAEEDDVDDGEGEETAPEKKKLKRDPKKSTASDVKNDEGESQAESLGPEEDEEDEEEAEEIDLEKESDSENDADLPTPQDTTQHK